MTDLKKSKTEDKRKTFGIGSLSLFIFIFAFVFTSYNVGNQYNHQKLGEVIIPVIKFPVPYDMITVLLLTLSICIGGKYKQHYFSKAGKVLSMILLLFFITSLFLDLTQRLLALF